MKRRNFTLSIKNDIIEFIKQVEQCPQYAWIIHDQDRDPETNKIIDLHVHAYIEFPNPRSFKSVAELLNVPEHMVCKVIDKNGIIQYLIHKNQPEKFQYDFNDITANFDLKPFFMSKSTTLWSDYNQLRNHKLTPNEFYEIHKNEIDHNAFYQKLRIFEMIAAHGEVPPLNAPTPPIHTLLKD